MRFRRLLSVVLSLILTISCLPLSASAEGTSAHEYRDGEVVIYSPKDVADSFGNLSTASDDDTVYIDFDDVGIDAITELDTYSEEDNMYIAETDRNVEKLCAELNESGDIIAEPNYILHPDVFTMPGEVTNNTYEYRYEQKSYVNDMVHAPETWQKYELTGKGVTVAVIDNGYDITTPDFPTNLWKNSKGTVGWNISTNSDDIGPIYRKNGGTFYTSSHGSNVAGIIGMSANNQGGVGIAYGAELMLIQAARYNDESTEPDFSSAAVARAIDFAKENGADVINLSLGSYDNSIIMALAISQAKSAGVIVCAAAGNDGYSTSNYKHYPASLNTVIGVMAIDRYTGKLADFSNYDTNDGQYYDIAAPGVDNLGCGIGGYSTMSGTSQATPVVAAVAALYKEKYPNATFDEFKNDLLNSAKDTVSAYSSTKYQYKSLNALQLLDFRSEHRWGEWKVIQEATCLAAGIRSHKCLDCGKAESESIPKADHDYEITVVQPTCRLRGYTQHTCKTCGTAYRDEYVNSPGHVYSDWSAVSYANNFTSISAKRSCIYCGQSQSKTFSNAICNCDFDGNTISGFNAGMTVNDFIKNNTVSGVGTVEVTPVMGNKVGTGSSVSVKYSTGDAVKFSVLIYGDLNGDGWYDGIDSVIDSGIANSLITEETAGESVYSAADCNHDGVIDELDVLILQDAGVLLADVDQSKSGDELLLTSSAYREYVTLISQTADTGEKVENTVPTADPLKSIKNALKDIIALIKSIIAFVKAGYPGLPFEK